MSARLKVTVVTQEKALARGEFDMVVAPSVKGQVGILPDHRPLLADLDVGVVELRITGGGAERYAVSGGFLEVTEDRVTLLADAAERSDQIDLPRAEEALTDAEQQLKKLEPGTEAYMAQSSRADRARNRLALARS